MTVHPDGRVWPDHEFPDEVFGYHADRNSPNDYGTPFLGKTEVMKRALPLSSDPNTYRLRVARYKLVEVEEIECVGERPHEIESS